MKNYIAIQALERVFATMISGTLPIYDTHDELMDYFMHSAAEQVRRIIEEDKHYPMEKVVDACEELAQFFDNYT